MEDQKVKCIECAKEFLLTEGFRDTGGKILCPRCFEPIKVKLKIR
jgi:DNA-directed RNA polymerase subunit RPC12/RpoP